MTYLVLPALLLIADHGAAEDVRSIIAGYKAWKPTTEKPVLSPGAVTALCAPASDSAPPDPHRDRYIQTYVSPNGRKAYDAKTPFPEGTVIVKEKYPTSPDDKTVELGVMIKHGKSWEYSFLGADGKTVAGEHLLNCVRCHAPAKNDSVFGGPAADGRPKF